MAEQRQILILGRPNVGKSTLFNRLAGRRISIVHDRPGVTRDFLRTDLPNGHILVDSGGVFGPPTEFSSDMESQWRREVAQSAVLLWVVDGRQGLHPLDRDVADVLRPYRDRVVLVVNKIDGPQQKLLSPEFSIFGFHPLVGLSAEHGMGLSQLWEILDQRIPPTSRTTDERIRLAIIGRPNVGKSSLVNALLNEKRVWVSDTAGTTRDAVECPFDWKKENEEISFSLIDTAGIRKKYKDPVDYFCSLRTHESIQKAHVVLLLLDPFEGVTNIDKWLAQLAFQQGKGVLWVITKWDRVQKAFEEGRLHEYDNVRDFQRSFSEAVGDAIPFLSNVPLIFTSAERREGLQLLLARTHQIYQQGRQRWPTPRLNRWLRDCLETHPPPSHNGKFFRAYYLVQVGVNPITMKVFCNRRRWLSASHRRCLENSFREHFYLTGCPVSWIWTEKPS